MLRMFLRFVAPLNNQPVELKTNIARCHPGVAANEPNRQCHRDRLLSMRIEHTRICSQQRCQMLRAIGVVTAGDLLTCDTKRLQKDGLPAKSLRLVHRYRPAIRLAASVQGMMPRDAQLLISVHRRSVQGIADESPAALHRDLVRFSLSTKGRRLIRGRKIPSIRRLKKYISTCKQAISSANVLPAKGTLTNLAAGMAYPETV